VTARSAIERVFREEAGRLTASLVRLLGDFDLAEEMVADAVVEALARWPSAGVPDRPGAWLLTTARHKALDRLRRDARYRDKLALIAALPQSVEREPDERLGLIFTCCHPALHPDAQVALTLRAVGGLSAAEIARAFLVPSSTIEKRLWRAKQKIVAAGIPFSAPDPDGLAQGDGAGRLIQVLRVIYLVFNEGYLCTAGDVPARRELAVDAEWLAGLLVGWLPSEPEPLGLLSLIQLHLSRWPARFDTAGRLVLLSEQDRGRWDRRRIASAVALIERAATLHRLGPYQLEAAIAAVHAEAPSWQDTDFRQLLALYDLLAALDRSPVVLLNRAVVLAELAGPAAALAEVDSLSAALGGYHLFYATRAALLRRLGRAAEAAAADREALRRTANAAEAALLTERLGPVVTRADRSAGEPAPARAASDAQS
jgi:RNA polymerase sigma-70 factor (ECF subfamily)